MDANQTKLELSMELAEELNPTTSPRPNSSTKKSSLSQTPDFGSSGSASSSG
jgi:hypothetical protein